MFFKEIIFIPKRIIKLFQNKIIFLQKIPMRISIMVLSRRTKKEKRGLCSFVCRNRIEGAPAEAGAPSLMAN